MSNKALHWPKGRSTFEKGLRGLLKSHRVESTGDVQEIQVSDDLLTPDKPFKPKASTD